MRRLVAVVLAQALVASSAVGTSLHVHEYLGHDHPDHHHGPAAHEHEHERETLVDMGHHSAALDDHELAVQADSCDPGRHAVSVSMACASVAQVHVDPAELPGPRIMVPSVPIQSAIPITDVRVHGPPFDARIPSRAPPVDPHA